MSTSRGATVAGWWPWLVLPATATSLVAVGLTLALVDRQDSWLTGEAWVNIPLAVGFSTVAAGIWSTGPHQGGVRRLAILYTVIGLGSSLVLPAYGWTRVGLPGASVAAWISNWVWTLGAPPLLGLGLLLYPDGRLPGRRWWPAAVLGVLGPALLTASMALAPGPLENHPSYDNPVGVLGDGFWSAVGSAGFLTLVAAAGMGLGALLVRYRGAPRRSDVRGQIGGFATAGLALVAVAASSGAGTPYALVSLAVGVALPLTVGIAVVRHRLLDQRADVEGLHRRVDSLSATRRELIREREEERVRLRRELHDGLGPSLAAIGLGLRQLEGHAGADQDTVRLLADEVQNAVAEVRRICDGLRPAALNELGLAGALTEALEPLRRLGPRLDVGIPAALPPLPPAVEVAAFRIAMEAATNAVRHADAGSVSVQLAYDDGLVLRVYDDGVGISDHVRPGVGLEAMLERAEEVGGRLSVGACSPRGTAVEAWLPGGARGASGG